MVRLGPEYVNGYGPSDFAACRAARDEPARLGGGPRWDAP